jgi:hypothetical protein
LAGLEAIREGISYGFGAYNPMRRASGPFGADWRNANRAGVFYSMFMPMFVALALFLRGQKLWRVAAIGGSVVLAGGTLFTYSRQSYLLVLLGSAALLIKRSVALAALIAVASVFAVGHLPESALQRVEETKQEGQTGEEQVDTSTASRWEIWTGAMQMLAENPLGVGLHRFKSEIGNYSSYKNIDAHSFYVLMLAEGSVFAFGAWLFLLWSLFNLSRRLRERASTGDEEAAALMTGFIVCTLCMALGGVYGSPNLEGAVMAPYWALAALLERYTQLRTQRAHPTATDGPSLPERFPLAAHLPKLSV